MIVVNARFLNQRITGVQRFAIEISKKLMEFYPNDFQFVTHPGIIHKELAEYFKVKIIGVTRSHFWEQSDLLFYLIRNNKPLLLSFGYTGPCFYKNQIVTVHDLAFKKYKETFSFLFTLTYNVLVPLLVKKCTHVLTVSDFSKHEIMDELGVPADKISVIYNGVSEVFKKPIISDNLINERYILAVSSHHPRKNYDRLLKAFSLIEDDNLKLYIVGNKVRHFEQSKIDNKSSSFNRVKFLEGITDIQLLKYYDNSLLFIFPSLYEGFGIPVIEAMSRNLICVLSDIPVFREIGDDQIIYVDPHDVISIKDGIENGLRTDPFKKSYNVEKFSWKEGALKTIKILNRFN